jgi:hypothetical protein
MKTHRNRGNCAVSGHTCRIMIGRQRVYLVVINWQVITQQVLFSDSSCLCVFKDEDIHFPQVQRGYLWNENLTSYFGGTAENSLFHHSGEKIVVQRATFLLLLLSRVPRYHFRGSMSCDLSKEGDMVRLPIKPYQEQILHNPIFFIIQLNRMKNFSSKG